VGQDVIYSGWYEVLGCTSVCVLELFDEILPGWCELVFGEGGSVVVYKDMNQMEH
jgi:hypothetical protein